MADVNFLEGAVEMSKIVLIEVGGLVVAMLQYQKIGAAKLYTNRAT